MSCIFMIRVLYMIIFGIDISHIGVGPSVVCSTELGSARASSGGTGNKEVPRFFYVHIFVNSK